MASKVLGEASVDPWVDGGERVVFIYSDVGLNHSMILDAALRYRKYCTFVVFQPWYPASFVKTCKGMTRDESLLQDFDVNVLNVRCVPVKFDVKR